MLSILNNNVSIEKWFFDLYYVCPPKSGRMGFIYLHYLETDPHKWPENADTHVHMNWTDGHSARLNNLKTCQILLDECGQLLVFVSEVNFIQLFYFYLFIYFFIYSAHKIFNKNHFLMLSLKFQDILDNKIVIILVSVSDF